MLELVDDDSEYNSWRNSCIRSVLLAVDEIRKGKKKAIMFNLVV